MISNLPNDHYPIFKRFPQLHEVEDKLLGLPIELGVEYERSTITIPLMKEGFPNPLETLVFTAFMRLRREQPTTYDISDPRLNSPLTRRQFRFKIEIWEVLGGKSTLLGGDVLIALSDEIHELRTAVLGREDVGRHVAELGELRGNLHTTEREILRLQGMEVAPDDANHTEIVRKHSDEAAALGSLIREGELKLNALRHEACKQPWSLCHADQMGHDFPATITYNAYFDVWVRPHPKADNSPPKSGEETRIYEPAIRKLSEGDPKPVQVVNTQPGIAIATNVQSIPPRQVVVTFHKPMTVMVPNADGLAPQRITFADGACTGMQTVSSKAEFLDGVNAARAIRGAEPLTIDQV